MIGFFFLPMRFSKHFFLVSLAAGLGSTALAQQPVVKAELDSVSILVGGQVGLNVTVQIPNGLDCNVLPLPDTLTSHVEVVSLVKADTVPQGDIVEYSRRYLITSFDTGLQYVPPIPAVRLADSSTVSTPEFALSVVNPFQKIDVDEQSGVARIFDIHSAEDAPFQWRELLLYWPWLVGAVVLAGLVVLLLWLRKKYGGKAAGGLSVKPVPSEPCEVVALRDLERIKAQQLWMHNQVKEFYSDLTDTLRRYVSSRFGVQAMESTSAQLIDALREPLREAPREAENLSRILEQADFAKFAKVEPLADENDRALADAVDFVNATTEALKKAATDDSAAATAPLPEIPQDFIEKKG